MAASGLSAGRGAKSMAGTVMGAGVLAMSQATKTRNGSSMRKPSSGSAANPKGLIKSLTGPIKGPDKGAGSA